MRISGFVVLCCLTLTACDHEPTFDASSLPAYQKSLNEIRARLSAPDQRKLETALLTLAVGDAADTDELQLANPGSLAVLASLSGVANPLTYLDRLRRRINGRSGAGVIRLVTSELDAQISQAESQLAGVEKLLAPVVIDHPRYYWTGGKAQSHPAIEFSVNNGSKNAISRIYVSGVLTSHDRLTPWARGIIIHSFERGLLPGEQVQVTIAATGTNAWTDNRLASIYDADFRLKVINIENTNGQKLVPLNLDALEVMRKKRDALRG
jgi:hypothetical protein